MQMKLFNRNIFLTDKSFFEKYAAKKELKERDFFKITQDANFMEHLWKKEINYYDELIKIVENIKLRKFYTFLGALLFLGVFSIEVYFILCR